MWVMWMLGNNAQNFKRKIPVKNKLSQIKSKPDRHALPVTFTDSLWEDGWNTHNKIENLLIIVESDDFWVKS